MICPHAIPDGGTGYHCRGGRMDGHNVSAGTCIACLAGKLSTPAPELCIPHVTFCYRFGLPTSEHACEVCTAERETDPEFSQHMRTIGVLWGATTCANSRDTGHTERKVCCGGKVKDMPVIACGNTGVRAECWKCRERTIDQTAK